MTLKLEILGIPFAKQSFRYGKPITTKAGTTFTPKYKPKGVEQSAQNIKQQIISQLPQGFVPYSKQVTIEKLHFCFPPLKSASKATLKRIVSGERYLNAWVLKTTKPDIDNLEKNLWDALNGIVFVDDSLICVKNQIVKRYSLRPRICLEITGE